MINQFFWLFRAEFQRAIPFQNNVQTIKMKRSHGGILGKIGGNVPIFPPPLEALYDLSTGARVLELLKPTLYRSASRSRNLLRQAVRLGGLH